MAGLKVKKGDTVVVLCGNDRGKSGRVLAAYPRKEKVLVEGVRVVHKSLRKSQDNPKGGIITKEAPIHISNVMLQSKFDGRRGKRVLGEGGES